MKTYGSEADGADQSRRFVGVSEYEVLSASGTLVAYGLGACVGLAVYDPENAVGGLAHAMLPRQSDGDGASDGKYVDAAVEAMLREAVSAGASYGAIEGYVVGGSDLLDLPELPREVSGRNVEAARETFADLGVPVEGSDVGGGQGRTVEFDVGSGLLGVITADEDEATVLRQVDADAEPE